MTAATAAPPLDAGAGGPQASDGPAPGRRGESRWRRRTGALAAYLATVFVLASLNFLLPRAMPGDPVDALLAQGAPGFVHGQAAVDRLEEYYGLDQPLLEQ